MDPYLLIGILGMVCILIAFLLNQLKVWKQEMLIYDLTNAIGSFLLGLYAYVGEVWPFLVLNAVWFLYSIKDVIHDLTRK